MTHHVDVKALAKDLDMPEGELKALLETDNLNKADPQIPSNGHKRAEFEDTIPSAEEVLAQVASGTTPATVFKDDPSYQHVLVIKHNRTCTCNPTHINCMSPKDWIKSQIGVWQFNYEKRDIRDKKIHPATFPISLARRIIELFTHRGELVIDPFVGSGTTLLAARDTDRNAVGFDLQQSYVELCRERLGLNPNMFNFSQQIAVQDDALNIDKYIEPGTVKLIWTSPPYANLLNRKRKNKSKRARKDDQFGKIEQYSQDPRDLGTMALETYTREIGNIYEKLLPLLQPKGHCVINIPDMWWENQRITLHVSLIDELRKRGYELRNIIIWDRTNIVNQVGIFGWPSNYITMGTTFEYLLHFWRPPEE